jgi:hypothetical protein
MDPGTHLAVFAGPTVPVPLPQPLAARLLTITARETDDARSAFALTFDAGRSGPADFLDSPLFTLPALSSGARVSVVVTVRGVPQVMVDGFVTRLEHRPAGAGQSRLVVTGEDASWLLDREEVTRELPMDDYPQVLLLLAAYAAQGLVPLAIPPLDQDPPLPIDRVPQQRGTDLAHLATLAERHGYVIYAIPGPTPGLSTLYWGPSVRVGVPQPAITIGQLPSTNVVGDVAFTLDAHAPVDVRGRDRDRRTGVEVPIRTAPPLRVPLSALPLAVVRAGDTRVRLTRESGSSVVGTLARAQAAVDRGADAVTATGTLDGARYGGVLRPRGLVGVRGAGWAHDGLWYVRSVEHTWARGSWTQAFTLARDGYGSTVPAVLP